MTTTASCASSPVRTASAGIAPDELFAVAEAALRAVLVAVGRADEWETSSRSAALAWVAKRRDVLAAIEGRVLAAEREAGTWGLSGDRDLAGFVGRTGHGGRGVGVAAVAQAATLEAMPVVADALVDGPVTTAHVAQIARVVAGSPALARQLATREGQAQVVELARRLDGAEFGRVLKQQAACLDPAWRQRSHDEQRANRSLVWTHTPSGTLVKGLLDAVAGHKLAKAIDALCPRPGTDDERSREQRQADALVAMVERTLSDKDTVPGSVAPVQAIVTFDQGTWVALRANRDVEESTCDQDRAGCPGAGVSGAGTERNVNGRPGAGSADDVAARLAGEPAVSDETGQPWPASEVGRALCDCALARVVVDAAGVVLDVGRESRLFGRQHWKALYAAGVRTCQMPGCGMPLAFCELHHIRWWDRDGGRTDLSNCAAYCSFHHHEIHRHDLRITRQPDSTLDHRHPDGRLYPAPLGSGEAWVGAPPDGAPHAAAPHAAAPHAAAPHAAAPPGGSESGSAGVDAPEGPAPPPEALFELSA